MKGKKEKTKIQTDKNLHKYYFGRYAPIPIMFIKKENELGKLTIDLHCHKMASNNMPALF